MTDFVNNSKNLFLQDNLRVLRKRMNWSQEELADKIGLNRGNIASYENGTAEPKICNLVKLANLFKVAIYDLTHNNLQEENSFEEATRRHQNGGAILHSPSLHRFIQDAEDMQNAIKGLECLFRLKIKNAGELPPDMQFLKDQFDQLHGVTQHLMDSHFELIALIKEKCNKSHHE
jgi:transcriptional regulator with XRE-family HTH domain